MTASRSRSDVFLDWLVRIASLATVAGFAHLVIECGARSEPRVTYSITIDLGHVFVEGLQNDLGRDASCEATVDRNDRLLVNCRKSRDISTNGALTEQDSVNVFDQEVQGLFAVVFGKVGSTRGLAVHDRWIETIGWEHFVDDVLHKPIGQWVENGRTRLHNCLEPSGIVPDLGSWTTFRASEGAPRELAAISGCDDQFSRKWAQGVGESADLMKEAAGLAEGTGPIIL